ncbi:pyridoxal 5'-phosphate synthase glutaminase subunit PdxT [Pseudoclavibacter endophyticus]|uniref:pyridoxal 5'-phosphate synthase glutaminase subunit PdxT n=1 Tax=Pseudoclavibacter endophyticus TaxID=1778590 RepID=UPI001E5607C5|nr:pyridoxal 5'-phosphate synthase glutaminase subunit PdxT [Pseudoclavibacter endophyticus]
MLALQGDVREHVAALRSLGAEVVLVRTPHDLGTVDGLVLPGGESTTIDKLSRIFGLREPIRDRVADGMPVLGTCAGLILLADRIVDGLPDQQTFGGLDVTVQRNAFGSQRDSFEIDLDMPLVCDDPVHAVFIRGPLVTEVGPSATVLGALPDGRVVAIEQDNLIGIAFHPEVAGETRLHRHFLARVAAGDAD